ncbi:MAG: substrate-binding domain-containing protein [Chloroflexota bacterium]|nr:substrate-binding domain-containing protein [Chloroflexota bacterium]
MGRPVRRREMLKLAAAGSVAALLAACGGNAATNTPKPAGTTAPASTTAAPAATSAPAATAAVSSAAAATRPAGSVAAPSGTTASAATAAPAATTAAATSPAASAASIAVKDTIKVGIVTSKSGPLASYGAQYLDGLQIGLDYATKGMGAIAGHKVQLDIKDDAGDPATGVAAAKDFIGQGYKIIGGSVVSGVALQVAPLAEQNQVLFISGPAAADAITGINGYTFRSGRQSLQDVQTAKSFLTDLKGKNVLVFAQDSAFGQSNVAAVKQIFGPDGATVDQLLVPQDAKDFAPFAQQVANKKADLVFVAWAGTTATAMYGALDSQGVLTSNKVVTGLDQRSTYPIFGPAADKIAFLSHYIYQAPQNEANQYLIDALKKKNQAPDLFDPDGFAGAQMIVHAIEGADGSDVKKMIAALEGYAFKGVKGDYTIRKEDHALLQPMFQVKLVKQGTGYESQPVATIAADNVAPPVKK